MSPKGRRSPTSAPAPAGSPSGWRSASDPTGRVYAQDVQRLMLDAIRRRVQREGLQNVETVLGARQRSQPSREDPRRGADGRRLSGGRETASTYSAKPGERAEADRPYRHRQLEAGPRRAGPRPPTNASRSRVVEADAAAAGLQVIAHENLPYQYLLVLAVRVRITGHDGDHFGHIAPRYRGARVDSTADSTRAFAIASVLFITALTAAAAQISVPLPFTTVPLTLQPMVVLVGGLALGSRLGAASQMLYLAAGIAGLPVFAASATLPPGALRLLGPTGGYLMAYPLAAFVAGYLAERGFDRRYLTSVLAMLRRLGDHLRVRCAVARALRADSDRQRAGRHAGRARDRTLSIPPAGHRSSSPSLPVSCRHCGVSSGDRRATRVGRAGTGPLNGPPCAPR